MKKKIMIVIVFRIIINYSTSKTKCILILKWIEILYVRAVKKNRKFWISNILLDNYFFFTLMRKFKTRWVTRSQSRSSNVAFFYLLLLSIYLCCCFWFIKIYNSCVWVNFILYKHYAYFKLSLSKYTITLLTTW